MFRNTKSVGQDLFQPHRSGGQLHDKLRRLCGLDGTRLYASRISLFVCALQHHDRGVVQ